MVNKDFLKLKQFQESAAKEFEVKDIIISQLQEKNKKYINSLAEIYKLIKNPRAMHQAFMQLNFQKIEYFGDDSKEQIRERLVTQEEKFQIFSNSVEKEIIGGMDEKELEALTFDPFETKNPQGLSPTN